MIPSRSKRMTLNERYMVCLLYDSTETIGMAIDGVSGKKMEVLKNVV
jgi:hypothetical protein